MFEDDLINLKNLISNFLCIEEYANFLDDVYEYNFENIDKIYGNIYKEENYIYIFNTNKEKEINEIIKFISWINHLFILYTNIFRKYIDYLFDNLDEKEIIIEYITKKNDLNNCALLINSAFENINIIINLLYTYKQIFKKHKSEINQNDIKKYRNDFAFSKKFSLYDLFKKIIAQIYSKNSKKISEKFSKLSESYFRQIFNSSLKMEYKGQETMKSLPFIKNFIQHYINEIIILQIELDDSGIIQCKNILTENFQKVIYNYKNNGITLEKIIDIIEKMAKEEYNYPISYTNEEIKVATKRIKFNLILNGYKILFNFLLNNLLSDFAWSIKADKGEKYLSLTDSEKSDSFECNTNLDDLSQEEKEVKANIEKECEEIKNYLIKKSGLNESESNLAKDYINCSKIECVILLKKLLEKYYKYIRVNKDYYENDEISLFKISTK